MPPIETRGLFDLALSALASWHGSPGRDPTEALAGLACAPTTAELLADYLPMACGRAFLREIKIVPSDSYHRQTSNGETGLAIAFSDDPLWRDVEAFVETVRTDPARRAQFSAVAQLSAEVNAVNNALEAGETLASLKGASFASVLIERPERQP